jgi:hypothetical protein
VGALALLRLDAAPLVCVGVGVGVGAGTWAEAVVRSVLVVLEVVAQALLWAQHGARHDRHLAVGEMRHDLDHVQLAVRLAFEDGAYGVGHVEIAVVGVLQLLDAERRRLVRRKVVGLVPLLNVSPHCLEGVVQLHRHGESAFFECSQGYIAKFSMSILLGQRLDQDRQSHADK